MVGVSPTTPKIKRKDFIRLAAFGAAGFYLTGCGTGNSEEKNEEEGRPKTEGNGKILSEQNVIYLKRGDEDYEKLRIGFNKRINKFPAVIALCKNTDGVVDAIAEAKKNNFPVAIKSGGHCLEGFSSNDGGMVINLSLLNKIEWGENKNEVTIGPACKVRELYDELLPNGKIIPAGSCAGVGIGGLTLGGGYGIFSRRYGLTCDSLMEVTMVDGNGKVISSRNDNDLLWACRGGGSGNFGVVTEMKFKTHEAPPTVQSHWFKISKIEIARAEKIFELWFQQTAFLPATCFSGLVLNGKTLQIFLVNTAEENVDVKNFIETFSKEMDKTTLGKKRPIIDAVKNYYGTQTPVYLRNSSVGLYNGFDDVKNFIAQVFEKVGNTPGMIYAVNTLGGKIKEGEDSAYAHRSFNYISELQTYWGKPEQEDFLKKRFEEVQQIFADNNIVSEYRNYPSLNFKNWEEGYYGKNYQQLQQLKNKYDPDNLFRYEQSVRKS